MRYPAQLSDVLDFGKHQGRRVEEAIEEDPGWVQWCIDNVDNFTLSRGAMLFLKECTEESLDRDSWMRRDLESNN